MSTGQQQQHGQAARIRSCTESETFDLAGQSVATITTTMEAAFGTPFLSSEQAEMIRITFITGAGKQARSRYDPAAAKTVTSILGNCGYVEDRGASCVVESAGCYKMQHDTGKNLKTIVVFPELVVNNRLTDDANEQTSTSLLPKNSPVYKIAIASMNVFPVMLERECPSWSQKKTCLESIQMMQQLLQELEQNLLKGKPLSEAEQDFYDSVAVQLDDKEALVKQELATHVEEGKVTQYEKEFLLEQNATRIQELKAAGKSTTKATERKALLEAITTVQPPLPLKHHNKLGKLYKELAPIQHLSSDSGKLLSLKETKALVRKEEVLQEIQHLEETSRGWFEDDDTFEIRVQTSHEVFRKQFPSSTKGSKKMGTSLSSYSSKLQTSRGGGGGGGVNKWVTPGESAGGAYYPSANKQKKKKMKGGGLFQAMIMEDSSDEEEDDDDDTPPSAPSAKVATTKSAITKKQGGALFQAMMMDSDDEDGVIATTDTASAPSSSKKKKSKKKKKKSKGKAKDDDDEYLESAVADAQARAKAEEENKQEANQTALGQTSTVLQTYIFPILVALLQMLLGFFGVVGKKQNNKKQQSKSKRS
mmetsp:Transcript_16712/g.25447  ORF Transcript_16712/g.25447 Transcript_16712/m.25447 type:complete len:591 (+) Transcript_16712:105-1877(+)